MKIVKTDLSDLKEVIKSIKRGEVIVCPTDTVYGVICDATNEKAVKKLFRIKKRPRGKPISIFVRDVKSAKKFAYIDENQEKFLKQVWPGGITAVLRPKRKLLPTISQRKNTIGVRIPDFKFVLDLIGKLNLPIAESSANISGKPASTKINEVLKQFEKQDLKPDLVLDAGNLKKAKPSTVIDLTDIQPKILRKGKIRKQEVMKIIKSIK